MAHGRWQMPFMLGTQSITNSHIQHGCGMSCSKIDSCMQCMQKEEGLQQRRGKGLSSTWLEPRAVIPLDPKPAAPQQTGVEYAIMQTCIVYIYMRYGMHGMHGMHGIHGMYGMTCTVCIYMWYGMQYEGQQLCVYTGCTNDADCAFLPVAVGHM